MMTQKDYEKIAAVFRAVEHKTATWLVLRSELASVLKQANSNFNQEKFYIACGNPLNKSEVDKLQSSIDGDW